MPSSWDLRKAIRDRVGDEHGALRGESGRLCALVYPSPYHVGMSSLGFQTIYRLLNQRPGLSCERAFLPDDVGAWKQARLPLFTYESEREVGSADYVGLSVAYELELTGLFDVLALSGLPVC